MRISKNRQVILLATLVLLSTSAQLAYGDVFTWNAARMRSILAEGRELTVLSGGATINSDATTIVAETIELWGTDFRYSIATGGVVATDEERGIILKCEQLFYDREEEIIRVDGFIDMQDIKNDVVVRGGFFEFYGKEEIAHIQIGVRILKVDEDTELACRSEFARYLRGEEKLELSGMPRVIRNEDLYTAARISINLDTDEILLDGDVSGTVVTDSGEEQAPEPVAGSSVPEESSTGESSATGSSVPSEGATSGDTSSEGSSSGTSIIPIGGVSEPAEGSSAEGPSVPTEDDPEKPKKEKEAEKDPPSPPGEEG